MKRGEVRWYTFKTPDKNRPVVILSRTSVIAYLGEVTIAPITTTVRDIPSEVFLSRHDGLPKDCAVNCDHIQTVSKQKVGTLISTLSGGKLEELAQAVGFALEL
jgi:mRNA interferase MazF